MSIVSAARGSRAGYAMFVAFMIAVFSLLVGLGTWQVQRKGWKEALIATLDERLGAAPVALPQRGEWGSLTQDKDEFRRVTFRAEFQKIKEGRVYSGGTALREDIKEPGYFAFAPARTADGGVIVINRGFVPNAHPVASLQPIAIPDEPVDLVGVLRWPEAPSWFVTPHSMRDDLWFVRDPQAMAAAYGWGEVAPFYIDQEAPMPPGGLPRPGALKPNLRNAHLQYAITWYGLAIVVAIAFGFWWRGRRREI
jgi:cytochrome oxidase assembly protein ShyY1